MTHHLKLLNHNYYVALSCVVCGFKDQSARYRFPLFAFVLHVFLNPLTCLLVSFSGADHTFSAYSTF